MEYDISNIKEKIKKLSSKEEKLNYLNSILFNWKKSKIEFDSYNKAELKRLKKITEADYNAYKNEFDNGRLFYFDNGKYEKIQADRAGIKNLKLLKERLTLENKKERLKAVPKLLKELIEMEKNTPSKLDFTNEKLNKLVIELSALNGYDKPSTYLNEILGSVKLLNDTDFEFSFFLNIFHSFKENAGKFWSEAHKQDISEWFNKCPYPAHSAGKDESISLFDTLWDNTPPPAETEQETVEIKPVLKPEAVQTVFEIIKDFFSTEQQPDLKQVIETGNIASKKLLFKGNGNRLTDTFKKLIEHDFITGCQKQDLINWIISNFTFTQQNKVKAFIYDTVEKTISRNYYPCKSPLIEIRNGQIQKVEQPRKRKQSKY